MTEWHGTLCADESWPPPLETFISSENARPGYGKIFASEYLDSPSTLLLKVRLLASLIKSSKNLTVYTGAGISTSTGIPDYGSKSLLPPHQLSPYLAQPSLTHHILKSLHTNAYLKNWIQQNHDGLPQKAGYPQSQLNEIHGSWYNPSNPVIPMSGELQQDLYSDLISISQSSDLVISLGTSMSGMTSDLIFTSCPTRVIINKQRTGYDDIAGLRIYGDSDEVSELLCREMGLEVPDVSKYEIREFGDSGVYVFEGYNEKGIREEGETLTLDLREGSSVKLVNGWREGTIGEVVGRQREGHYKIRLSVRLKEGGCERYIERVLGFWWLEGAKEGSIESLPLVNV
ncbi:hypothetical protein TrVE_jg11652 [Triparma verrucosa]|uniref:Deacetylase sirtuin-type domain-containing protein n=1 Tax=Triparma verrucosa TaxID=1606542 RepID=A0A9W6ZCT1_9STRA|nr:hypothetical protein TrVE_jg11652 [Triparma verrucosa]